MGVGASPLFELAEACSPSASDFAFPPSTPALVSCTSGAFPVSCFSSPEDDGAEGALFGGRSSRVRFDGRLAAASAASFKRASFSAVTKWEASSPFDVLASRFAPEDECTTEGNQHVFALLVERGGKRENEELVCLCPSLLAC